MTESASHALDQRLLFDVVARVRSFRIRGSLQDTSAAAAASKASTTSKMLRWIRRGFTVRLVWGANIKHKEATFTIAGVTVPAHKPISRGSTDAPATATDTDASATAAAVDLLHVRASRGQIAGAPLALVFACTTSPGRAHTVLSADSLFAEVSTKSKVLGSTKVVARLQPIASLYDIATGPQDLCLLPLTLTTGHQCLLGISCVMTQITPHASIALAVAGGPSSIASSPDEVVASVQMSTPQWSQLFERTSKEWTIEMSKLTAANVLEASIEWRPSQTQLPLTVIRQEQLQQRAQQAASSAAGLAATDHGSIVFCDPNMNICWNISWRRFPMFWQWTRARAQSGHTATDGSGNGNGNGNGSERKRSWSPAGPRRFSQDSTSSDNSRTSSELDSGVPDRRLSIVVGAPLPSAETVRRCLQRHAEHHARKTALHVKSSGSGSSSSGSGKTSDPSERPLEFALRGCLPESLAALPESMRTHEKLRSIIYMWRRMPALLQSMTPSQHTEFVRQWTQEYIASSARGGHGQGLATRRGGSGSGHTAPSNKLVVAFPVALTVARVQAENSRTSHSTGGCTHWTVRERMRRQHQLQFERDQIALVIGSSWHKITSVASSQQQMIVRWKIDRGLVLSPEEMAWITRNGSNSGSGSGDGSSTTERQ